MYSIETKALLIYDGDCGFCQKSVNVLKKIIGDVIDYMPYQFIDPVSSDFRYAGITDEQFNTAVQFVIDFDIPEDARDPEHFVEGVTDKRVYSAAEAIFKALEHGGKFTFLMAWYRNLPLFKDISEFVYRQVAGNRKLISSTCSINPSNR